MKIDLIAGARPNFVKIASIVDAIRKSSHQISFRLIHTGQHYDPALSDTFFRQLDLPQPDINLNIGSGSQARQMAAIMVAYEEALLYEKPDICIVVGDVTSSMACAITAKKLKVKVAHVEAGLRSFDWGMPEEVNRVLIDSIADLFFTTTTNAAEYLIKTGSPKENVHFVGNTMIDTLLRFRAEFKQPRIWNELQLEKKKFIIITLHRPGNVDDANNLKTSLEEIVRNTPKVPIIFPVHPRTLQALKKFQINAPNLYLVEPLSYLEFNYLVEKAMGVITDSGGVTEETTVLGIPCITLRNNTERPETVTLGTNEVIGTDPASIGPALGKLFQGKWKKGEVPEYWDGKTGERIIKIFYDLSQGEN